MYSPKANQRGPEQADVSLQELFSGRQKRKIKACCNCGAFYLKMLHLSLSLSLAATWQQAGLLGDGAR